MGYVYRYMCGDQWIYVGKAKTSIDERVKAHSDDPKFQSYLEKCEISYIECQHNTDMDAMELALIKTKKPLLNVVGVTHDAFPFTFQDDMVSWTPYKPGVTVRRKKVSKRATPPAKFIDTVYAEHHRKTLIAWYESFERLAHFSGLQDVVGTLVDCVARPVRHPKEEWWARCPYPKFMSEAQFRQYMVDMQVPWYKDITVCIPVCYKGWWDVAKIQEYSALCTKNIRLYQGREAKHAMKLGRLAPDELYDYYCCLSDVPPPKIPRPVCAHFDMPERA